AGPWPRWPGPYRPSSARLQHWPAPYRRCPVRRPLPPRRRRPLSAPSRHWRVRCPPCPARRQRQWQLRRRSFAPSRHWRARYRPYPAHWRPPPRPRWPAPAAASSAVVCAAATAWLVSNSCPPVTASVDPAASVPSPTWTIRRLSVEWPTDTVLTSSATEDAPSATANDAPAALSAPRAVA